MPKIAISQDDCINFTVATITLLEKSGFHVRSAMEAYECLQSIVESQVAFEIDKTMQEECQCPNCKPKVG